MRTLLRFVLKLVLLPVVLIVLLLVWLRWDAYRPQDEYFAERQGSLDGIRVVESDDSFGQRSEFLTLSSDSGLEVSMRVMRPAEFSVPLPVLIVLGGHRTGSDAVGLFGDVGERAVVAVDYPYTGPEKVRGVGQTLSTLPLARKAFIDTPPAVWLVTDWIQDQEWANPDQVVIIGASLGVPFAALAAARDTRIAAALLVHGAADNQVWLERQVERRNDNPLLIRPLATFIHWLAYAPTFDTAKNVALIAPRPVIVVGATEDERTPEGQIEALFAAAGEPKTLRWTAGNHVQPNRPEIIAALLRIAEEELPFGTANR